MKDAQDNNPVILPFRFLLVCAIIALRTPVAHPPILRNPYTTSATTSTIIVNNEKDDNSYESENSKNIEIGYSDSKLVEISSSDPLGMSKARVYTDVNVHRPKEYWDYESLTVQWG